MDNFRENLRYWNGLSAPEVSSIHQNNFDELMEISDFADIVYDRIYENCGDSEIIEIMNEMNILAWTLLVLDWKNTHGEDEIRQFIESL